MFLPSGLDHSAESLGEGLCRWLTSNIAASTNLPIVIARVCTRISESFRKRCHEGRCLLALEVRNFLDPLVHY